jgi:hypothetical protein
MGKKKSGTWVLHVGIRFIWGAVLKIKILQWSGIQIQRHVYKAILFIV